MCPEIFQDGPYSTPVDMFATGVVLFNLLSGTQPFDESGGNLSKRLCSIRTICISCSVRKQFAKCDTYLSIVSGLATDEVVQGNIEALNWCLVEMKACQWSNQPFGYDFTIYGIVTNGEGWKFISREAQELITSLLLRDPDKRPSACGLLSSCRWVQGDAPRWVSHCNTGVLEIHTNYCVRVQRCIAPHHHQVSRSV